MNKTYLSRPGHLYRACATLLLFLIAAISLAQSITPPSPLQVTVISNITATTIIDCPTYATCIDNRSQQYRRNNYESFQATGTGTWSVQMQFADGSPTSWTSFGASALVTNTGPVSGVGYGIGYHDFYSFVITGTATVNTFSASKNYWTAGVTNTFSFPITNAQGGSPGVNDQEYGSLTAACTAAGTGTLYVTKAWNALAAASYGCNMEFLANGVLQPAASATVTLTGTVRGDLTKHFDLSQSSAAVLITGKSQALEAQWFGVKGDNSTNDTTAVGYALATASASSKSLHFGASTYLICNASYSGSGPVTIFGDGMFLTTFHPYGGASGCSGSAFLMKLTTTGAVNLHDFGTDGQRTNQTGFAADNIVIAGPGSTNALTPPSSVTLYNLYTANAQSVGIQCQPCQNVSYTNSISYKNYFFAASFASSGTSASPLYVHNFNVHGITSIDDNIGVGMSFFLSDMSITGNVFMQSSLDIVQVPHAYATIEGNTFDGIPDQGCFFDNECGDLSYWSPIFFEGVSDWTVGVNHISNIGSSAQGALTAIASNLNIGVSTIDLPTNRAHIDGLIIDNSNVGFSILVTGTSNGPNPAIGSDVTVKNTKSNGVNQCLNLSGVSNFDVSNNQCLNSAVGGYTLSGDINGTFQNNYCENCNTASGTTYSTGTVSGTATSASITGVGTTFTSGMVGGGFTVSGTTYPVCSRSSNTAITLCVPLVSSPSGASYSLYYGGGGSYPGFAVTGSAYNIHVAGNKFVNENGNGLSVAIDDGTSLTPAQSLITYDSTNTCTGSCGNGIYLPVPTVRPTFSCGSGGSIASYATNTYGLLLCGSTTTFSITFAGGGFTETPNCSFTDSNGDVFSLGGGSSGTVFNGVSGNNLSGIYVLYSCNGVLVNQGQYPYPYLWR